MGLQGRGQCWKQGEHLRGSCNNSRHDTKAALKKAVEVKMGKENIQDTFQGRVNRIY